MVGRWGGVCALVVGVLGGGGTALAVPGGMLSCRTGAPPPPPGQSRGFGSDFRFPDQAGAGGATPAGAAPAAAPAGGAFASAGAAEEEDDLYA